MDNATRDIRARQVWGWPIVVALLSTVGLVTALVGDGVWDVFSWAALALPVVISGVAWMRSRRAEPGA
jgi:hypothetical protein